jgi:hypothetical protein
VAKEFHYDTGREERGAEKFIAGPDVIESKPSGLIFIVR